jgi:hypothetical protein
MKRLRARQWGEKLVEEVFIICNQRQFSRKDASIKMGEIFLPQLNAKLRFDPKNRAARVIR